VHWFKNRLDAKVVIEDWRREYNAVRQHSSLGNLTPFEFAAKTSTTTQGAAIF
jgi:putative transposase